MFYCSFLLLPLPNRPPQEFIPNQSSFPTWSQLDPQTQWMCLIGLVIFIGLGLYHAGRSGKKGKR